MPRVAVEYRTSSREVYEKFVSTSGINISFEKWKEVIYTYAYLFRDYILETGKKPKLPWGLGSFTVCKKKVKKFVIVNGEEKITLPIDWIKSNKAGKRIYLLNAHTDGYRFKWVWFPKEARLFQREIWVFKPSRVSSRKLADYLKKPNSSYAQMYGEWLNKNR